MKLSDRRSDSLTGSTVDIRPGPAKSFRPVVIGGASFTAMRARLAKNRSAAVKRLPVVVALCSMPEQIAEVEDVKLQFARQLYDECLERHGEDHQETRLLWEYIFNFEMAVERHC